MDLIQSAILGLVQGFTEFLPVSSSGHLAVFQILFGVQDVPLFYDVMLHVGTLVAVFMVLWPEITAILSHPIKNKLGMLVLATIPAVIAAVITSKVFPETFDALQDGKYLAFGFYATAVVLVVCELIARKRESNKKIELPQAMSMGIMQAAAALVPGLSRSGSTIAGGLFSGAAREQAAKYAFLMSIPAILGSVLFTGLDVMEQGLGNISVPSILLGMATAAISGYIAIRFMLNLISKHKLYGFAIYVAALGTFILIESVAYGNIFTSPFS